MDGGMDGWMDRWMSEWGHEQWEDVEDKRGQSLILSRMGLLLNKLRVSSLLQTWEVIFNKSHDHHIHSKRGSKPPAEMKRRYNRGSSVVSKCEEGR